MSSKVKNESLTKLQRGILISRYGSYLMVAALVVDFIFVLKFILSATPDIDKGHVWTTAAIYSAIGLFADWLRKKASKKREELEIDYERKRYSLMQESEEIVTSGQDKAKLFELAFKNPGLVKEMRKTLPFRRKIEEKTKSNSEIVSIMYDHFKNQAQK
jgi:hypothetical protein